MLTEEGSIRTQNIAVGPALWLYRKKLKVISLISLIIGAAGVIAYIVLGTVLGGENEDAPDWVSAFLVFAVPLALGLIGYITIVRLKKRETSENQTAECTFFADCFFYNSRAAQRSATVDRFAYSGACLKRENEDYGYIFVASRGLFLVFSKKGLQSEELNAIRKNFGQAIPDGETVELKNYENNKESN